jgi:type IV pilus assembly protein PilW
MKTSVLYKKSIMKPHNQTGLTLLEIMIALLLGVFLIAGFLQIFASNKQSYRLAEGQSRLQENGRYALELLSHDIRLTGFMGCSGVRAANGGVPANPTVIANDPLVAPFAHAGIPAVVAVSIITGGNDAVQNALGPPPTGSFASPSPALSSSPLNGVIVGTDAVTVQFGESCGGYTTAAMPSVDPTGIIAAGNTCGIALGTAATTGTPLIISDCSTADAFRASAGTSQNKDNTGAAISALSKSYPAGSEILRFRSYTYFLQPGASGQPALWRLDNNYPTGGTNPEEMIEGIENMQITYGADTDADGSANQYLTAPVWANVVSLRIVLTARSIDDNLMATVNPARLFNGANITDRRLVKTITATIDLRNR